MEKKNKNKNNGKGIRCFVKGCLIRRNVLKEILKVERLTIDAKDQNKGEKRQDVVLVLRVEKMDKEDLYRRIIMTVEN